jgi:hypothetical protein
MAKDILIVPVSTISSESTFSMTGRIIEERRRKLKPKMVEMLTHQGLGSFQRKPSA